METKHGTSIKLSLIQSAKYPRVTWLTIVGKTPGMELLDKGRLAFFHSQGQWDEMGRVPITYRILRKKTRKECVQEF